MAITIRQFFLTTCLSLIISLNSFGQSPWVKSVNEGYFQLGYTYYQYNKVINEGLDSITDLKRSITDQTAQLYFEYGILNRLTITGDIPFKLMQSGSALLEAPKDPYPNDTVSAGNLNHLGNVFLSAKYALLQDKFPLALQIGFYSPGTYSDKTGLRTGYDCWSIEPRISLGQGFNKFYYQASAGYQYKSNHYSNNFLLNAEGGRKFAIKQSFLWLMIGLDIKLAITEEHYDDKKSIHTATYRNNEEHLGPAVKIGFERGPLFITASNGLTFWENYGGAGPLINLALAYKFKPKQETTNQ